VLQNKPELSNFITLEYVSSKKMIDIHLYCQGYENSKGQAIIQEITAHWAIKNKWMVNVSTFALVTRSDVPVRDLGIE
jgi:hypothetical protein